MVEVRFQTEADCIVWNNSARAKARFGPDLADLVSMCLQQIAALDSPEDIVRLPFTLSRDDTEYRIDIRGEVTVVGRVHDGHGSDNHAFVVEAVVAP